MVTQPLDLDALLKEGSVPPTVGHS
jgi:hypothetical protein